MCASMPVRGVRNFIKTAASGGRVDAYDDDVLHAWPGCTVSTDAADGMFTIAPKTGPHLRIFIQVPKLY